MLKPFVLNSDILAKISFTSPQPGFLSFSELVFINVDRYHLRPDGCSSLNGRHTTHTLYGHPLPRSNSTTTYRMVTGHIPAAQRCRCSGWNVFRQCKLPPADGRVEDRARPGDRKYGCTKACRTNSTDGSTPWRSFDGIRCPRWSREYSAGVRRYWGSTF